MREARAEFDEDCYPDINDEGRQNYLDPRDREILELQDSDEKNRHHSEVSSNVFKFCAFTGVHSCSFNCAVQGEFWSRGRELSWS